MAFQLGVCYYPEHWPEERWAADAHLMRAAGLSIVRIGEFAWKQMEPAEGSFDFGWLDRAIDTLAAEGLKILLGTPTPTPPAWLVRAHPEILQVGADGHTRQFGSRRHCCANSPIYREYTQRIVTRLAERYANHPAVVGWQIDNEFGCHDTARCYCRRCVEAFRRWLENRYQTIEALNEAWGAVFWSQGYNDWREIEPPHLTVTEPNPSHVLDYYRFASDSWVDYERLQVSILRRYAPGAPISHNYMGNFPDLDYHRLAEPLDWVTWDSYPTGYQEKMGKQAYLPGEPQPDLAYDVGDPYITGFCHDLTRGIKRAPHWVMEQQCGNVNWADYNTGVRPGTPRLWTWHALTKGANAVVYFRWRAVRFGQEQMHSGLRNHDASAAVGYNDVCAMLSERELMDAISSEPLEPQVAILSDYNDLWALQLQPHRKEFHYQRLQFVYYGALQRLGIQTDVVSPQVDLSRYRLVIAPTVFLVDEQLTAKLRAYVENGGTLLLGIRSGFKTTSNVVTDLPLPGLLRPLAGATVATWHALPPDIAYSFRSAIPGLDGKARLWVEELLPLPYDQPDGQNAQELATYTHGPFTGRTALVQNPLGKGEVYYLGFYPALEQARVLLAWLAERCEVERIAELPEGVVAARRGHYTLLLNFTEETQPAQVNGQTVLIPSRDVRIVATGK